MRKSNQPQWVRNLPPRKVYKASRSDDLATEDVDTLIEIIIAVEAARDKLRDTLKELTTATENECRHDTVLRKALSPYCEAARLALEAKDD